MSLRYPHTAPISNALTCGDVIPTAHCAEKSLGAAWYAGHFCGLFCLQCEHQSLQRDSVSCPFWSCRISISCPHAAIQVDYTLVLIYVYMCMTMSAPLTIQLGGRIPCIRRGNCVTSLSDAAVPALRHGLGQLCLRLRNYLRHLHGVLFSWGNNWNPVTDNFSNCNLTAPARLLSICLSACDYGFSLLHRQPCSVLYSSRALS